MKQSLLIRKNIEETKLRNNPNLIVKNMKSQIDEMIDAKLQGDAAL